MSSTPVPKSEPEALSARLVTENPADVPKPRHRVLKWTAVLFVLLPTLVSAAYLWIFAVDQYSSSTAFAVRSEEYHNPLEALGAFTQIGGSSSSDAQILYDFIKSQPLVEQVDEALDLRELYGAPERDPVFALARDASVEDLIDYWDRMVQVSIETSTGVISLEVRGFTAKDAKRVTEEVLGLSANLVDDLSRIARDDATKFTREEVEGAQERLKAIRLALHEFRMENDTIDPGSIVTSQMGVVAALQNSLAQALVERGTILGFASVEDQRVRSLDARIAAIREQISEERRTLASSDEGLAPLVEMMGTYEALLVDLEFAQNAYTAALASAEQANAEARRKSRYLAVHIPPTEAEDSLYPQRALLTFLVFIGSLAAWAVAVLIYYNVRDRS